MLYKKETELEGMTGGLEGLRRINKRQGQGNETKSGYNNQMNMDEKEEWSKKEVGRDEDGE